MEKTMKARVQHKHDIEANWLKATNFTPLASEIIVYDPDENYDYPRIKIGDGKTNINTLPFVTKDYAKISDVPTKPADIGAQPAGNYLTSIPDEYVTEDELNAKGYLTSYTETDPTVPSWAKAATKPSYTASEVGALPSTTKIPGALSDLSEDTAHRVVTDAEKEAWNAKSNFSGNYNDLINKPAIPSIEGLVNEQDFNNAIIDLTQDLQNISNYLTPQMYGAKADGVTDDTEAINAAINAAGDGSTVFIPDGIYLVRETDSTNKKDRIASRIDNKKNLTLLLSNEAVIKHDTSPSPYYRTIRINNSENITIRGGRLIGELDTHTPETTENGDMVNTHGYGIRAIDSSDITIDNIELSNYYGDPLIFCSELNPYQGCKNVTVTNCKIHDSARNGITVTSCQELLIQNCEIYNINKAMPKAGIDIEGEYAGSINENITIDNCNIHSNGSSSICAVLTCNNIRIKNSILGNSFTMSEKATNIVISNCKTESVYMQSNMTIENSTVKAISLGKSEPGNLVINCKIAADKTSRHHVDMDQVDSKCQFINCEFTVPETFDNEYFYNFRNNSYGNHENQYSGDLSFENCVIQTKPIKLPPFAGGFKKISLINCNVIGMVETTSNQWFGIGAKEIFIRNSIFDASQLDSSSFSSLIKLNCAKVFVEGTLIKTKENVIPTKMAFSQVLNSDESTFEKAYYINNILTAWTNIGSIPEEANQRLIIGNIFADTLAEEDINDLITAKVEEINNSHQHYKWEFVNSSADFVDKTKTYVLSDGNVYHTVLVEEITYNNVLLTATDTDKITIYGEDYNNDGKKDGYLQKKRLSSSSGEAVTAEGMCASGFIKVEIGKTLRIKGTVPKTGTASYVIAYNDDNVKTGFINLGQSNGSWTTSADGNSIYENDVLIIPLTEAVFGAGFTSVRFSGGYVEGTDIIATIDQELAPTITEVWEPTGFKFISSNVNIDNKLDADKLPEAVNAALAQAKESGEFKGEPGFSPEITISTFQEPSSTGYNGLSGVRITTTHANGAVSMAELFNGKDGINGKDGKDGKDGINGSNGTSVTIQSISQTTESGEISTVTFSDGKKLEIANGKDGTNGRDGTDGKDGTDGYSGVYVGSSEPPINANVKIDPNGEGSVLIIPDVLQTIGDSEVDTMSQKAITELLNSIGGSGGSGSGEPARSIVSINRTSGNGSAGSTDTYTITYTDGTTSTFTVYNGTNGTNGTNGKTAYESAKSGGYTGTEANFNTTLNNVTKYSTETWTFTLEDDSTVTKKVVISS